MKKSKNISKKVGLGLLMVSALSLTGGAPLNNAGSKLSFASSLTKKLSNLAAGAKETLKTSLNFDSTTESTDQSEQYGYKWDAETKTLTLSGLTLETTLSPALSLPAGAKIYIEKDTTNLIDLDQENCFDTSSNETNGVLIGNGASSDTVEILGYGTLNVSAGHVTDDLIKDASNKQRTTVGVKGSIIIGNGIDSPNVKIETKDDEESLTIGGQKYPTISLAIYTKCNFTLNSGIMHLKTGKAGASVALSYSSSCKYYKGKIILEGNNYAYYGTSEIQNNGKNKITIEDINGQSATYKGSLYLNADGTIAKYLKIDVAKQIQFASSKGKMEYGTQSSFNIFYTTKEQVDDDTIQLQYYSPDDKKYIALLPNGFSSELDESSKNFKLSSDGNVKEGMYQFRLAIISSQANGGTEFYSDDFTLTVYFQMDGSEYSANGATLEESENPTKTNEAITITASDGYQVSSDGTNYGDSVTYDTESDKTNPKTHASLFIKRDSDGNISEVEFDYALDTTGPTASLNGKTTYVAPSDEKLVREEQTISLSDINDSLSENENIKKEYAILSEKLTEEDLKEKDATLTWANIPVNEEGNYSIDVDGDDGETKVLYIKLTDEAGNITYLASDAYSFDKTTPNIIGLDENKDYYVTTAFTLSEDNVNITCVSSSGDNLVLKQDETGNYILPGNVNETYTITVTDKAGNTSTKTVKMHSIESLSSSISAITEDNVTTANKTAIEDVQSVVQTIDSSSATASELASLKEISNQEEGKEGKCEKLLSKIKEISDTYESVEKINDDYSSDKITSDNVQAITAIKDNAKTLIDGENLTDVEQKNAQKDYDLAVEYLNKLSDISSKLANIADLASSLHVETVTSSSVTALTNALTAGENLLTNNSGNLTLSEKETLNSNLQTIEALLSRLQDVSDKTAALSEAIFDLDEGNVTSASENSIKNALSGVDNILETNLTSDEKQALGQAKAKAQSLLDKIKQTKSSIDSIEETLSSLSTSNVTSDNENSVAEAQTKIATLLNGNNITEEERKTLENYQSETNSLLSKIEEVKTGIETVNSSTDGLTKDNITSSDISSLETVATVAETLIGGNNLTETQKTSLASKKTEINELLTYIKGIKDNYDSVISTINDLTSENVTANDETKLNDAKELANAISENNLTEEEKAALTKAVEKINTLLSKIKSTSEEIKNIDALINGKTIANVKNDDKNDLESAQTKIATLLEGSNLTSEQEGFLREKQTLIQSLLEKMEETSNKLEGIDSALNGKTTDNVKSSDEKSLASAKNDIESLLSGDNITQEQKAALKTKQSTINSLLSKISETSNTIKNINDSLNGKNANNVKSSDEENLNNIKNSIDELLTESSSNLTDAEKSALQAQKTDINAMLSKIEEVKQSISSVKSSTSGLTESNVTSSNKGTLEEALASGNSLISGENLTAEEKADLQMTLFELETLISKINDISSKLSSIDESLDGLSESNVTSANKDSLESIVTEIDSLLNGTNLTEKERTALIAEKANAEKLLVKIETTSNEYQEIKDSINALDEEESSKEELQEIIDKANDLKNSGNLTSEEVAELNQFISKAQTKLDKMESKVGNLWWLIITLGIVALIEALAILIKKHKLNKKEKTTKANVIALPALFILASVTYPVNQIVACIILGILVIILAVILSILCIDWDWWKEKKNNKKK